MINSKSINKFVSDISKHKWELSQNSANYCYNQFYEQFIDIYNKSFPLRQVTNNNLVKKPWITTGLYKSIKHKNKLY